MYVQLILTFFKKGSSSWFLSLFDVIIIIFIVFLLLSGTNIPGSLALSISLRSPNLYTFYRTTALFIFLIYMYISHLNN